MCDCIVPPIYSFCSVHKLGFPIHFKHPNTDNARVFKSKWGSISLNSTQNHEAVPFPSDDLEYGSLDFGHMEKEKSREFQLRSDRDWVSNEREIERKASSGDEAAESSNLGEFLNSRSQNTDNNLAKEARLAPEFKELDRGEVGVVNNVKRMARRSNFIAKQVISISSALCLGFVSQLWVDTSSKHWVVLFVEVRPNLLSGDFKRFHLEEIAQVGDVILIEDKNVVENDFRLAGLETLVGYTVVTPNRRSIGKVRGYTFNINSGTVESIELDSFGTPIIPSNLVSTYALFIDDVLEVLSDTIIVHEAAASRIQRLTKGLWDGQNLGNSMNELLEEQPDINGQQDNRGRRHKNMSSQRRRPKVRKRRSSDDDWELPMDFF